MPTTLRPRSTAVSADEQAAALAAPVADPSWFLARQWQTAAFAADDGGDPIRVALAATTAPITVTDAVGGALTQPGIEAEPAPAAAAMDTAGRASCAAELFRIMRDHAMTANRLAAMRAALAAAFPLHPVTAQSGSAPHTGRLPDAAALITLLASKLAPDGTGPFPTVPGINLASDPQAEPALRAWYAWTQRQAAALGSTGDNPPARWDAIHLGYTAAAQAQLPAGPVALHIDAYDGTGLDWHIFDRDALPAKQTPPPAPASVRPTAVTFPGMPQPRFWAFERGDVNLDIIADTDPARALLATFAHAYSNDWFVLPLDVAPGATVIDLLQVTDSFATTTAIAPAAALDAPDGSWRMWELTPPTVSPGDPALGMRVFLAPCAPPLEGPALDDLLVARDEMANLGWIIELATRDEDGGPVDRNHRWLQLRRAADPTYNPATAAGLASYRLGTSLPDYWYPLLAQTGPGGAPQLALATLPLGAADVSDDGVAGHVIPHAPQTVLADEEAARTGTQVNRVNRLDRISGTRTGWRARVRRPGTGEASSGLRFDLLGTPAMAANLVANPDFTRARRQPSGALSGSAAAGLAAAEQWNLWNGQATTTTSHAEPTTRPGGTGWMLRVTTGAGGCGLTQQWDPTGTGPAAGHAEAWVYVIRGSVTLGSGNGGNTGRDTASTRTGKWEQLTAPSGHGPVNQVNIYAAPSGGAEFFVDFVAARTAAG